MFNLIKEVINSKSYKLEDMLYKINKMYIESYISEQEKTELDNLARENADPKKYICKIDGCVWSPDAYPSAWEEVA